MFNSITVIQSLEKATGCNNNDVDSEQSTIHIAMMHTPLLVLAYMIGHQTLRLHIIIVYLLWYIVLVAVMTL